MTIVAFVYLCFGYLYLGLPLIFIILACLCMPFLLFCFYLFSRGDQVPANTVRLSITILMIRLRLRNYLLSLILGISLAIKNAVYVWLNIKKVTSWYSFRVAICKEDNLVFYFLGIISMTIAWRSGSRLMDSALSVEAGSMAKNLEHKVLKWEEICHEQTNNLNNTSFFMINLDISLIHSSYYLYHISYKRAQDTLYSMLDEPNYWNIVRWFDN